MGVGGKFDKQDVLYFQKVDKGCCELLKINKFMRFLMLHCIFEILNTEVEDS